MLVLAGAGLLARFAGWIGLWFTKTWGLIAFSLSVALLIFAQSPDPLTTRLELILEDLETLTSGLILGLAFFGFPDGFTGASRRVIGDAFS